MNALYGKPSMVKKTIKNNDPDTQELCDEIDASLIPKTHKIDRKKIRVLIFGPDLKSNKPSSTLRKYIIRECTKNKYNVVLSKHQQIQQLCRYYQNILGLAHNLCRMEYHLAIAKTPKTQKDIIDGIVIIPDSAGSFIELGMLALADEAHLKTLVLFNESYSSRMNSSFVGLGAKAALDNKAKTKLIDYNNKSIAFTEVSNFLSYIRGEKVWNEWIKTK